MGADPTLLQTVAKKFEFEIDFMVSRTAFLGAVKMVSEVKSCFNYFCTMIFLFMLPVKQQRHRLGTNTRNVFI